MSIRYHLLDIIEDLVVFFMVIHVLGSLMEAKSLFIEPIGFLVIWKLIGEAVAVRVVDE